MKHNHITIQDPAQCCGCRACANACPRNAITMRPDAYGFFYPDVDTATCVDCGKCLAVCDFAKTETKGTTPFAAYAAIHKDRKILKESSSGGVFWTLADYVLETGGAVCGCVLDKNLAPIHVCSEKTEDVVRMRRSKYAQSDVGLVYRDVAARLSGGQTILFTGTPCQIAALYEVLGQRDRENLITVDLVCHGVPSALMFRRFIDYLEKKYRTEIVNFNFRSKKYGWQRWTTSYTNVRGAEKNLGKINEFYIPAFTVGNLMRPSCFICKYACPERVGDITVGDFWGHEKADIKMNTEYGLSLVTLNTARAKALLPLLADRLSLEEIDYQIAVNGNRCLHAPTEKGDKWDAYMEALKNDTVEDMAKRYIQKNKKKILRNKLKMRVPYELFAQIRKKKYRK